MCKILIYFGIIIAQKILNKKRFTFSGGLDVTLHIGLYWFKSEFLINCKQENYNN